MGLMGFLRKGKRGAAGAKKQPPKGTAVEEGPTILPELPKVEQAQEGTNSTEPESTHHEGDAIVVEEASPYPPPPPPAAHVEMPSKEPAEPSDAKADENAYPPPPPPSAQVEIQLDSQVEASAGDKETSESESSSSFEIIESSTPDLAEVEANNEATKDSTPQNETSYLEKFKSNSPVRRGNTVAERAAWLENGAFKGDEHNQSPVGASPVSHENARAKKMFWEGKTFPKETSNAPDPPSVRHRTDVMAKKKWLETVAFTPSGGGNMTGITYTRTPEKRKHTIGLLPASPVNSYAKEEGGRVRTAKLIEAIDSYDKQTAEVYLDKEDDPYEWAYEVWFKNGLLPWRSSSFAEGEVSVCKTMREDILSPSSSRSWGSASPDRSSPGSPSKYSTGSPISSPSRMESVQEQEQADSGKEDKSIDAKSSEHLGAAETEKRSVPDISAEFGSSSSPSLPLGPEHDVVGSDSSMISGDADETTGHEFDESKYENDEKLKALFHLQQQILQAEPSEDVTPPSLGEEEARTPDFPGEVDEKINALFQLQQKILQEVPSDVTPPSTGEEEADTPDETDYHSSELFDETDEDLIDLFQLQQRFLQQFRQETDEGFEVSDEEPEIEDPEHGAVGMHCVVPHTSDGAAPAKNAVRSTDDGTQSTDSSEKLRRFSKQYFVSEYTSESRDFSADGEASGVHLEPSIVTHASSITAEDISVGDALAFMNSSFGGNGPDPSTDVAASFELMDEMQFHSEMTASSDARGRVLNWQKDHFAGNRSPSKDHAPSQPSRKVSTQGSDLCPPPNSEEREQRTSPVDHAPAQPSRKISVEGQDLLPLEPNLQEANLANEDEVAAAVSRASDHAPAQPTRKISVEGLVLVPSKEADFQALKQDTAPISPVRVASMEAMSPLYSSESLRILRAKKIATAMRGQYVMWLALSRRTTFRKSAEAPTLSWFGGKVEAADVKEEQKPILIPFLSVPPRLEDKFLPRFLHEGSALIGPRSLSRVNEAAENSLQNAPVDDGEMRNEGDTSFNVLKQDFWDYISPSRRKAVNEARDRLESAKKKNSAYMRRAFGVAQSNRASAPKPEEQTSTSAEAAAELHQKLTEIPVPGNDDIQKIFEEVDRNGDGKLTLPEVERAIIQRKEEFRLPPTIVMRAFQKTDANGNGSISRGEFFHFVRCINYFQNLLSIFEEMDKDGNRRLSREEFVQAAHVLNVDAGHAEGVFDEMDENAAGYVCFDEFCLWMGNKRALEDVAREAGSSEVGATSP